MLGTLRAASIGTRAGASILTTFMVFESMPFISITAAQMRGRNEAELEPSSSPVSFFAAIDIGAGIEAENAVGRLLIIRRNNLDRRARPLRPQQGSECQ